MEFIFSTVKNWAAKDLSQKPIFSNLQYWLVKHPTILNFSWDEVQTPASSPLFLTITVLSYLSLTFLLSRLNFPPIGPRFLKSLIVIHNLVLVSLSFIMAFGCILSILHHDSNFQSMVCYPKNTKPDGPLFFWAYVFYLSKIFEFMDTLLIILSRSTKRLTFLHVYHHAAVVVMCYISLRTSQSMFSAVLITNATVHVIMYFYYLLCALGRRPSWKKLVTDCQIVQFVSSFWTIGWIFYYHFTGSGCSGIWGWYFDTVFIISLLFLFLDFHSKNYSKNKGNKVA